MADSRTIAADIPTMFRDWAPEQWVPHQPDTWPWRICRLKQETELRTWHGHNAVPEWTSVRLAAGTLVKIVMVSRFGDVGITDDLNAYHGYKARVDLQVLDPVLGDDT